MGIWIFNKGFISTSWLLCLVFLSFYFKIIHRLSNTLQFSLFFSFNTWLLKSLFLCFSFPYLCILINQLFCYFFTNIFGKQYIFEMYFNIMSTQLLGSQIAIFALCFHNGKANQTLSFFSLNFQFIKKIFENLIHVANYYTRLTIFRELHKVDPAASCKKWSEMLLLCFFPL